MLGVFLPFNDYYPMFLLIRLLSAICNEAADLAAYTLCMEITGLMDVICDLFIIF